MCHSLLVLVALVLPLQQDSPLESIAREQARWEEARTAQRIAFPKFAATFERAAERAWKRRTNHRAEARIEDLRKTIDRHARDGELTLEVIESVCDPARDELLTLVFVTPEEAYAARAGLAEDSARLRALVETQRDARAALLAVDATLELPLAPPAWDAELDALVLIAGADARRDRQGLIDNRAAQNSVSPEEYAGTLLLNRWRVAFGMDVVTIDGRLTEAARDHSKDMAELDFFSHTSPIEGKESFGQRAARFKTSASSENIAKGATTGADAIQQWWYSPGHHRNLLGDHSRTGLGHHAGYWTQLFGR
ncbi:MAG: CAP domain-containing protein [Planctomycetota bacterium]